TRCSSFTSSLASRVGGQQDNGVGRDLDTDAVTDPEDGRVGRRQLHADRRAGANVDLVEIARTLEDAKTDGSWNAPAAGHGAGDDRQRLRPQDEDARAALAKGADSGHRYPVSRLRRDDHADLTNLHDLHG